MTTDADPKAKDVATRVDQLEERASRITGAVWFMLDTQFALLDQLAAKSGDAARFRQTMTGALTALNRADQAQLSERAKATYGELLVRLRDGPPPTTPYISPEVERTKIP